MGTDFDFLTSIYDQGDTRRMELAQESSAFPNADENLSEREHHHFGAAIRTLRLSNVPFLIAGGLALYHYTGFWRETKDLDLLILPEDRDLATAAFTAAGFPDFHDEEPYDREWIFRSRQDEVIVDLIWRMANKTDEVYRAWFDRATPGRLAGEEVQVVSAADLCWLKLFVLQEKRCDWPHILNIIRGTRGNLDWSHLLSEAGQHWRLLCAVTDLFDWLCPSERNFIPESSRLRLQQLRAANADMALDGRQDLLDSRPWLAEAGAGFTGSLMEPRRVIRAAQRRRGFRSPAMRGDAESMVACHHGCPSLAV